jgi:hypothetical protein
MHGRTNLWRYSSSHCLLGSFSSPRGTSCSSLNPVALGTFLCCSFALLFYVDCIQAVPLTSRLRWPRRPANKRNVVALVGFGYRSAAVTQHTLRHTHVPRSAGMDILTVKRRLGHSSPAITLTVCSDLLSPARCGRDHAGDVCKCGRGRVAKRQQIAFRSRRILSGTPPAVWKGGRVV